MRRFSLPLLAALFVAFPLAARAADPRVTGEIDAAFEAKKAEIAKEYDGRNELAMTNAERRERAAKENAALKDILRENGVSEKEYTRSKLSQNRERRAEAAEANREWKEKQVADEKKKEEAKKKAAEKEAEPAEIPVQRGFDAKNPVTLHEGKGAPLPKINGKDMVEIPIPQEGEAPAK
jgi:hypothetical protein